MINRETSSAAFERFEMAKVDLVHKFSEDDWLLLISEPVEIGEKDSIKTEAGVFGPTQFEIMKQTACFIDKTLVGISIRTNTDCSGVKTIMPVSATENRPRLHLRLH